jgi:hypothetical protein
MVGVEILMLFGRWNDPKGCQETTCCSVLTMSFDTVQYNHEAEQTQKHSPFKHTMLMLLLTTVTTDLLCPFCHTEASNHPQAQWKHHGLSHPSIRPFLQGISAQRFTYTSYT